MLIYDMRVTSPRALTPDDQARVVRAALAELRRICAVPPETPERVEVVALRKGENVRTA